MQEAVFRNNGDGFLRYCLVDKYQLLVFMSCLNDSPNRKQVDSIISSTMNTKSTKKQI